MNISQIYEKEKEYLFFSLISEKNINGLIERKFRNYRLKAYIDYQVYSSDNKRIDNINTRDNLVGLIRIPVTVVDENGNTEYIEIKNGDCLVYNNRKFELIEVRKIRNDLKHYYMFYLTDFIEDVKYDIYKTELNTLFYNVFNSLGIEAVVHNSFFQNSYFEKIEKPFLIYEISQMKEMSDYTTRKTEISEEKGIKFVFRSNRRYRTIIKLYDKDSVLDLDVILSKNKIINDLLENLDYKLKNLSELEVKKLDFLSENDTIINNRIYNEKIYSLEFTVDTFYSYIKDNIKGVRINRKLRNGG